MFHTWHQSTRTCHAREREVSGEEAAASYLDGPVRRRADDVVAVGGEGRLVHKRRVATELLQSFARLQPVDSAPENKRINTCPGIA